MQTTLVSATSRTSVKALNEARETAKSLNLHRLRAKTKALGGFMLSERRFKQTTNTEKSTESLLVEGMESARHENLRTQQLTAMQDSGKWTMRARLDQ